MGNTQSNNLKIVKSSCPWTAATPYPNRKNGRNRNAELEEDGAVVFWNTIWYRLKRAAAILSTGNSGHIFLNQNGNLVSTS